MSVATDSFSKHRRQNNAQVALIGSFYFESSSITFSLLPLWLHASSMADELGYCTSDIDGVHVPLQSWVNSCPADTKYNSITATTAHTTEIHRFRLAIWPSAMIETPTNHKKTTVIHSLSIQEIIYSNQSTMSALLINSNTNKP